MSNGLPSLMILAKQKNIAGPRIRLRLNSKMRNGEKAIVNSGENCRKPCFKSWKPIYIRELIRWAIPNKAALFGFCVALVAYNVLAVVKATLYGLNIEKKR